MAVAVHITGQAPYEQVHELQQLLLTTRIRDEIPDVVLLLEHPETITLGRKRGAANNVLDASGVPVVKVERGGDVTWHGPGQLVAYPILKLEGARADLHKHLHSLEAAVSGLLTELGCEPHLDDRNTGVWLTNTEGTSQKVCSIGIACRQWVSWHGLALNVDVDLQASFSRINPCGFDATIMTRLADHLSPCPAVHELAPRLVPHLGEALQIPITRVLTRPASTLTAELTLAELLE